MIWDIDEDGTIREIPTPNNIESPSDAPPKSKTPRNDGDRTSSTRRKYYLVVAGYANLPGFLAPYRGTRYHLQKFGNNTPTDERELFNRRHSSLWNTIERTFEALKARFKIVKDVPPFDFDVQVKIMIACCILHNYICMKDYMDLFEDEEDDSNDDSSGEHCEDNNESENEDSDSSNDIEDDVDTQRST
ncbi:uncharacterized protein [Aristolochia californica]|uniref:uncharacterized protein n=1 Tax=Aristolochia californica TaxID=171875 RepID=UPI0035D990B2